jgi:hypothetical protein
MQELMSMLKEVFMALRSKWLHRMATIALCRDYSMQELMSTKEDRRLRYGTQKAEARRHRTATAEGRSQR